jgi:hypothetical protein
MANMTKTQRIHESAGAVYGVLNPKDSKHFWHVGDVILQLLQPLQSLATVLPSPYLKGQQLTLSLRDYYKSSDTFWTRIWTFAERAVAKSFIYLVQNHRGSYTKVSRQQILNKVNSLQMAWAAILLKSTRFPTDMKTLIMTDIKAAKKQVGRFTQN